MTALAPADVETMLLGVLAAPVDTSVPNPRPASFTRVTRAGGSALNLVQSATRVLVECWGPTRKAAFDRAAAAYAAVGALERTTAGGIWIARVELTEPVNLPDEVTKTPKFQFVAQLTTSLQEIA